MSTSPPPDPTPFTQPEARRRAGLAANAEAATDPTKTTALRRRYAQAIRARYRAVAAKARELLADDDFIKLQALAAQNGVEEPGSGHATPGVHAGKTGLRANLPGQPSIPSVPAPAQPDYDFPTRGSRTRAYLDWLRRAMDDVVIGDGEWANSFVRYAHGRGVVHANSRLRTAGYTVSDVDLDDAFNLPIHRDTLSTFYRRQYELLGGVNRTIANDISRELTQSMLEGVGPREAGRRIGSNVRTIGTTRGTTIARTELVHAYNEGALNRYERILGSTGKLQAVLELQTAGDSRVCPECASLEGSIYTVADARNVIPIHPLCRCTWIPQTRTRSGRGRGR